MKTLIIIKADYNDGDYVHGISIKRNDKQIEFLKKIANAIKIKTAEYSYMCNWNRFHLSDSELSPEEIYKDILTEDEISDFDSWISSSPHGVHTIESISFLQVESKEELLDGDCYYE